MFRFHRFFTLIAVVNLISVRYISGIMGVSDKLSGRTIRCFTLADTDTYSSSVLQSSYIPGSLLFLCQNVSKQNIAIILFTYQKLTPVSPTVSFCGKIYLILLCMFSQVVVYV